MSWESVSSRDYLGGPASHQLSATALLGSPDGSRHPLDVCEFTEDDYRHQNSNGNGHYQNGRSGSGLWECLIGCRRRLDQHMARRRVEQGLKLYRAHKQQAAVRKWRGALKNIRQREDKFALLGYLYQAYMDWGKYRDSIDFGHKQLCISEELDSPNMRAEAYLNLARAHERLGALDRALDYARHSLYNECDQCATAGLVHLTVGRVHLELAGFCKALEAFQRAHKIAHSIQDPSLELQVYVGLSELFCRLHDADKSARYAARAYDLSRSLQLGDLNSRHHRAALLQMAAALRKKGELGDAHDYCSEATRLSLVSGDQASYARSIRIMGDIYRKKSDINKAFRQYESAMGSAAATGDRLCQMEAMDGAARCLEALRLQHKICNCRPLEFNTRLLEVAGSVGAKNNSLEDGLGCPFEEDDLGEEEEYDALNDETFGSEATIGDWEKDHEKLAEITESSRPHHQSTLDKKNVTDTDIEDNLSHLVLDDKEGIIPRPGVWDCPSNLSLPKLRPPLSLTSPLTNVCTVEQLEKGLIANRPPPRLNKPVQTQQQQHQQQQKSDGSLLFESLSAPPRFPPGLGIPPPHPVVLPPNVRFHHPQFLQHPRLLPNQTGNVLRYPLATHLMLPHTAQRQPIHNSFCNNFPPQAPLSNLCPPPFLRADHSIIPPFSSNQTGHQQQQHSFSHSGNQRNQNRAFHHGEQQGNHQPFFKNNQYHRNHDRNNQRQYHYNHHSQGMNGVISSGEYDEYAGLMSSREKQWLINIQLLQLNTNEPYVDDYYYIVFCDRRNRQSINQEQKDKKQHNNNNNNSYHRDSRDREQPHALSRSIYIPAQFENSLGKLQFASVIAPRKVIDMDVVPNSDPQLTTQIQQKDTKRTRQLLLEIERLYIIQLRLEDLHNPLALLNEQQQNQEGENEANNHKKSSTDLINMILSAFLQLIQDDKLPSMLSIRKGKTLLLRFFPYLNVTEHRNQLEEIWNVIFRGLAMIGRRDSHLLMNLHSEFQRWFDTVHNFGTILRLARSLSDSASQPIKNNSLAFALTNKFGVSVIASMFEQAEKLYTTDDSLSSDWSSFITNIIEIIGETPPCVAPCRPIAANTLNQHLNRLSHLKCGRYTTLELLLTDANPSR